MAVSKTMAESVMIKTFYEWISVLHKLTKAQGPSHKLLLTRRLEFLQRKIEFFDHNLYTHALLHKKLIVSDQSGWVPTEKALSAAGVL